MWSFKLQTISYSLSENPLYKKNTVVDNLETFTKCFDELGCVNADESWFHKKFRPVNLKPLDREVIKTQFILIRENETSTHNVSIYDNINFFFKYKYGLQ